MFFESKDLEAEKVVCSNCIDLFKIGKDHFLIY